MQVEVTVLIDVKPDKITDLTLLYNHLKTLHPNDNVEKDTSRNVIRIKRVTTEVVNGIS